jgi:hypothetical protein
MSINETNKGIIYLVQPAELKNTDRYKIGMSSKPNLDRCSKGYKKGTRYLVVMESVEPKILERAIKKLFKQKFNLIAGAEYFQADEKTIINEFINCYYEHNKNIDNNIDSKNINNTITFVKNGDKTKIYRCIMCNKEYTNKTSKYKHQRKCIIKNHNKTNNNNKDNNNKELINSLNVSENININGSLEV